MSSSDDSAPIQVSVAITAASAPSSPLAPSISAVDVFADSRAQITRLFPQIALTANRNSNITIVGLPNSDIVEGESVRVEGRVVGTSSDNGATLTVLEKAVPISASILDVTWSEKWVVEDGAGPEKVRELEAQLETATDELETMQASLSSIEKKLAFIDGYGDAILGNRDTEGANGASVKPPNLLSQESLDSISAFFTVHTLHSDNLQKARLAKAKEVKKLGEKISALESNLARLRGSGTAGAQKRISEVGVLVKTSDTRSSTSNDMIVVELTMIYIVNRASWSPFYDVRVNSDSQSVDLTYKAKLVNRTGEPWTRVTLSLSTSRPTSASTPPTRPKQPWHITIRAPAYYAVPKGRGMLRGGSAMSSQAVMAPAPSAMMDMAFQPQMQEESAQISQKSGLTGTSVFKVPGRPTINADGAEHAVTITRVEGSLGGKEGLVPKFEYFGYLKTGSGAGGENVWAEMKVTNATEWELLEGPAGVFVDDAFVARVPFPSTPPSESFSLALGPSPSLRILRKPPLKTRETSSLFSSGTGGGIGFVFGPKLAFSRITERSIVKNARSAEVKLVIVDQLPTSQDERIKTGVFEPAALGELIRKGEKEGRVKANVALFPLGKSEELLARRASSGSLNSAGSQAEAIVSWTKDTGVLEWSFTLPGGMEALLVSGYEVAWPVGENVDGL